MDGGRLVILAGGISSRMKKPAENLNGIDEKLIKDADTKTKSMIGVGENYRPFLDYLLYNAKHSNYTDIVIVIGENDNSIKEYYGYNDSDNNFYGMKISYAVQKIPPERNKPLGTADALLCGLLSKPEWKGKKFTVCNSDNLYSQKALKLMLESPYIGALVEYDREGFEFDKSRVENFAVVIKNEKNFLVDIIEKPSSKIIDDLMNKNGYVGVSMNLFSLTYDLILPILETVPLHPERNEKELPEAVKILANQIPNSVFVYSLKEHVPDLTNKSDIKQVKRYLETHYKNINF